MKIRTFLLLLILIAVATFSALNWQALIAPTTLSLGFSEVQAPLGLVMLGLSLFLIAFFLVFVLYSQTAGLMDARHHAKELRANRALADKAEASRFTDLRIFLDEEINKLAIRQDDTRTTLLSKMEGLERELHRSVEDSGNTLSAYIGELEDRLEKRIAPSLPQPAEPTSRSGSDASN